MKIALLQPPPSEVRQSHDQNAYPSLALGYLAAYLEKNNFSDLLIIDGRMENISLEKAVEDIVAFKPDLLGVTAKTHEITQAAKACELAKKKLPTLTTIVGGCHLTAEPSSTLELFPAIDYGLVGEGEISLFEICQAIAKKKPFNNTPGLVYRKAQKIIVTPARPFIEDLDNLPFPAWHRFRIRRHSYMLFGSRGCPYNCVFCMRVLGNKPRLRSPENIVAEIEWLIKEFAVKAVDFEDETFGLRRDEALRMCDIFMAKGFHKQLFWTANLRANLVDEQLLQKMKDAGCVRVAIGVESGNPEILQQIGKSLTLPQIEEAFRLTRKVGLESVALMIIGHPHETRKTAIDTIRLATKLNSTSISVGIMVPYPGTKVREMALQGQGGYRLLSECWEDYDKYLGNALELDSLSRSQLERLQIWAYLRFYSFNFRFKDLYKFFQLHTREAFLLLRKLVLGK